MTVVHFFSISLLYDLAYTFFNDVTEKYSGIFLDNINQIQ